jgi:hypothetical protein
MRQVRLTYELSGKTGKETKTITRTINPERSEDAFTEVYNAFYQIRKEMEKKGYKVDRVKEELVNG